MRFFLATGAIFAALSVILGAFGAHALAPILGSKAAIWQTGVSYQMFHSLALLAVGILMLLLTNHTLFKIAGVCFLIGILLFSGSLYTIGLIQVKNVGIITPIGGLFFIGGWLLLLTAIMTSNVQRLDH